MTRILTILVAALVLAAPAFAAPIDDVRALGYTVTPYPNGTGYRVVGFGVDSFFTEADLAALANPAAHCNRKWQADHPDQLAAFDAITRKGYGVSGDQCADRYTIANGYTAEVVWTGPGAGLPDQARTLQPAQPATQPGPQPAPAVVVTQTCLPLCPAVAAPAPAPAKAAAAPAPAPEPEPDAPAAPARADIAPVTTTTLNTTPALSEVKTSTVLAPAGTLNPLLAATVSRALGQPITITRTTTCYLAARKVGCAVLYGKIAKAHRHVTVTAKAGTARRITVA